ncbi:MAG TPA: hypothetical protein VF553_14570 [Pyrinomonadaceae bacterium]|jgi:hypothetical protein
MFFVKNGITTAGGIEQEYIQRVRLVKRGVIELAAVKELLLALAEPSLRLCFEHPHFARLLSCLRYDLNDSLWPAYRSAQAELTKGFRKAFAAALPGLPAGEVRTRLHYVLGAVRQVRSDSPRPAGESPEGLCSTASLPSMPRA